MMSPFGVDHGVISKVRGEEYNAAKPYERLSAEKKRRHLAAEGAAYGGAAAAAGFGGSAAANAKFLGTRTGQGLLEGASRKYGAAHPLTPHIKSAKKVGLYAARHKGQMTGAVLGAAALGGAASVSERFRRNEEQGISQGLGRIKAGSTYSQDQKKVLSKKYGPLRLSATLADVNWKDPKIVSTAKFLNTHRKGIGIAGAGAATGGGVAGGIAGVKNRRTQTKKLRAL